MEKIEALLGESKWRLLDLFKDMDKNKDWKVLKSDFLRECQKGRLNASNAMIEELMNALGADKSSYLNYKSLASGRNSHLIERRNQLKGSQELIDDNEEQLIREIEDKEENWESKMSKRKNTRFVTIRILNTKSPNNSHKNITNTQQSTHFLNGLD